MVEKISRTKLKRLSSYLRYLTDVDNENILNVSSNTIAEFFSFTAIQVRKDLAEISKAGGKPKTGFSVKELIVDIKECLGYDNVREAVLVGVGKLGKTLLAYRGFKDYGLKIVAGFDDDQSIVGTNQDDIAIYSNEKIVDIVSRLNIRMGIITVPKDQAQRVCDELISAGILAIWNFAPTHLKVPDHIVVKYEDMGASLAYLSNQLNLKIT